MQTPVMTDGQVVKAAQMALIVAAIRAWQKLVLDLLLAQLNTVVAGGFALSANAGNPIQVNDAGGEVVLGGYDIPMAAGSYTFGAADNTYHRYDLMTIAYSQASGTDTSGAPTLVDTGTRTVVAGVALATPTVPATPAGSVAVGWLDIPPGATSATTCTIHPTQGPYVSNSLPDLSAHLAAVFNQASALHGFLVTTPGGVQSTSLAQTDGSGRVGHAITADNATTLGGVGPGGYDAAGAAAAVQANLGTETTNRTNADTNLQGQINGMSLRRSGITGTTLTDGSGNASFNVTFSPAFPNNATAADACFINYIPTNATRVAITNLTKTGMTINLGIANNSGTTVQASWGADGN